MLRHRRLSERGDTIVEVLIAIAIASFVLVSAYVTANKNALSNQDAQERSQALQLAQTQLEFLHSTSLGAYNCFDATGTPVGTSGDNSSCIVNSNGSKNTGAQPKYTIAVTKPTATTYKVDIGWDSLISTGQNHINLYYQP